MGLWSFFRAAFPKSPFFRKEEPPPRRKRVHGRRQVLLRELLQHKWLDHYELARRTAIPFQDVSKLLATAIRDGERIERIKKRVEVPEACRGMKRFETVWVYRLLPPVDTVRDMVDKAIDNVAQNMAASATEKMEEIKQNILAL